MRTHHEILVQAISGLHRQQKDNLRWHAENKTPILCGWQAGNYLLDGKGWPAVLACAREVPQDENWVNNIDDYIQMYHTMMHNSDQRYYRALEEATEITIRAAIMEATSWAPSITL